MTLDDINEIIRNDMQSVNAIILDRLKSDVALINQLGIYIIGAGGKRLRPMLAILCSRALSFHEGQQHLLAAIVEFIHTATLLHDDVVDESSLRRGKETANELFGNQASVLVGDYLYTRAFQMMVELDNMKIMKILSDTTNKISEGEVMQLMNCNDANTTEQQYFQVIESKTAALFEATTRLSAVISHQPEDVETSMANYGRHLGNAFQLADDALDYSSDAQELGKNIGDDLAEGKPTLPLIYAMKHGTAEQATLIRQAIENGGLEKLNDIIAAIQQTGALDYTLQQAKQQALLAKESLKFLEPSDYRTALETLADYSVTRTH